ncbi:MAG: GMC family oxidoreductase N-terminal domain-containing protein [Pseudomonadota bacterium]|nr:GMC family oxidoreductase N-terminal domain-containing protein [Pseudomonadota bacterium]
MEEFDYIIIGAGSAGCVLANRLTDDGANSVCILEAGPPDWNPFIHIPAGFMRTLVNPKVNWLYEASPSEWTAGRVVAVPRGKTLGGSSSINGHVYNRGQRMDFDSWAQLGNSGWGYSDVLPYFKRCEQKIGEGDELYRGRNGNLKITDLDWRHPLCDAFIKGANSLGIPTNTDYNGASQEGVSYVQRTTHKRLRVSSAKAFLNPAKSRKNLTVYTESQVTRILFEERRAFGVELKKGGPRGQTGKIYARKEIILSGGAINSPQLLQLSGIGSTNLLKELGIPVVHNLPGVGENLRDHYAPRFTARVKNIDTINEKARGAKLWWEVAKYFLGGNSIVNLSPTLVYCFWHSDENVKNKDLQLTFTPASYKEGVQSQLDDQPGFTIASWQQRPESSGFVRAKTANPFEAPEIQPNYLQEEGDRTVLLAGMKLARNLMRTEALKPYFDYEQYPGEGVKTDEELLQVAKERGTTTFHVMGTCRMGPETDPLSVVDESLCVRGIEGLRVIDASIMPNMLSANLNAAVMMIAEKGADMILGKEPLEPILMND